MGDAVGNYLMWGALGLLFVVLGGLLIQLFSTFKMK
jgi:hypothetical protein